MSQVQIVRHDLGEASAIGGLVARRDGTTYLIVHFTLPLREVIALAREMLTPLEMAVLRNRRACDLAWSAPTAA